MENREVISQVNNLTHVFVNENGEKFKAVNDISLSVLRGEILGIVGESGSGKSTLARCLMNIYTPTAGSAFYEEIETTDRRQFKKNRKMLCTERQIVFQDSDSSLNHRIKVRDIVAEPLVINGVKPKRGSIREEVLFQLEHVGLGEEHLNMYPYELSGGMRQRVAIARAIVNNPALIVADEPTGNLNPRVAAEIVDLFEEINKRGTTIVMATHAKDIVDERKKRVIAIEDGVVARDEARGVYGYEN